LDLVVFGRAAALHVIDSLNQGHEAALVSPDDMEQSLARLMRWDNSKGGERVASLRLAMKKVMQQDFSVFRTKEVMTTGLRKLEELQQRLQTATLSDKTKVFNTARIEALELDNLMGVAVASAYSALAREESRGAHSRIDFPKRDDKNWLKHTMYFAGERVAYRPVNMKPHFVAPFEPKERVY
jgi:succinate dehydrogenase / fumarate reductase, flavoprotein subunit